MKVVGIGLNKTGTKTLRAYLKTVGFKHHTYDLSLFKSYQKKDFDTIFKVMDEYDSFEDWPWPLMYKEIDRRYDDAFFVLSTRKTPEVWYKSLCKMAVRMGPMSDFEKPIYGYSMPHGRKKEHIDFYNKHNNEVEQYFKSRPEKFMKICFGEEKNDVEKLSNFLGLPIKSLDNPHRNKSPKVYDGDNLTLAHLHRIRYQTKWYFNKYKRKLKNFVKKMI